MSVLAVKRGAEGRTTAKAAFDQAVKSRPGRIITLRQKARGSSDLRMDIACAARQRYLVSFAKSGEQQH